MYNESQKSRFMDERNSEVTLAENYLQRLFVDLEPYEEELGKDISQFTTKEILNYFKVKNMRSLDLINNYNSQLSAYTQWCLEQNLVPDGINHFMELNQDVLNTCVNRAAMANTIMSRERVLEIASEMKNPRERFVLLMLFETGNSKHFSNIFYAKPEDFDFDKKILHTYEGRTVDVSDELIHIVRRCIEEDTFIIYKQGGRNEFQTQRKLINRGYVYKETETVQVFTDTKIMTNRLQGGMKEAFKYIGLLSWTKLNAFAESGLIWDIKQAAMKNDLTISEVLRNIEIRNKILYQHNYKGKFSPKQFMRKYGDYL